MRIQKLPLVDDNYLRIDTPGWEALIDKLSETCLRTNDVNRILGISSRQLNDWDDRGMLGPLFKRKQTKKARGWREFNIMDLVALGILQKAKQYGIPITYFKDTIGDIFAWNEHFDNYLTHVVYGLEAYFYSDLTTNFGFRGCQPGDDGIKIDFLRIQDSEFFFVIRLNTLIHYIFAKLELPDFIATKDFDGCFSFKINGVPLLLENLLIDDNQSEDLPG